VEDWVYSVSGTQAIAGTADTLWGLARSASSDLAMLRTYGRDTDEANVLLRLKPGGIHNRDGHLVNLPFGWVAIGRSTSGAQLTPERESIIRVLDDRGSLSITDLAARIGEEYDSTQKQLKRMADLGLVRRSRGGYSLIPISLSEMSDTSTQRQDISDKSDTRDQSDIPDEK
jgi:DNA-binding transcriptional ArsR family regulator